MSEKKKSNKAIEPNEEKVSPAPSASPEWEKEEGVKIKFRANRAAEGVAMDAEGCAIVDEKTAAWLVSIGYAEYV